MISSLWLDNLPMLGQLAPEQAVTKLREVGEIDAAEILGSAEKDVLQTYVPGLF